VSERIADIAKQIEELEEELRTRPGDEAGTRFLVWDCPHRSDHSYISGTRTRTGRELLRELLSHLITCQDAAHHAPIPKMFLTACRKRIDVLARELRKAAASRVNTVTVVSRRALEP
jgi:hypothetical protein